VTTPHLSWQTDKQFCNNTSTGGDDQVLELPTEDNAAYTDAEKIPSPSPEHTTIPALQTDCNDYEFFSTHLTFENEKSSMKRSYSDDALDSGTLRDNTLRHNLSQNMMDLTNINDEIDSDDNNENFFEQGLERNDISDADLSILKSFSFGNLKGNQIENYSSEEEFEEDEFEEEEFDTFINDTDIEDDSFSGSDKDNEPGLLFDKHKTLDTISETSESEEDEEESLNASIPLRRQKAKLSTGFSNLTSILESPGTDSNPSFLNYTYDNKTQMEDSESEEDPVTD